MPSRKAATFKAGKFMQDRVNGLVGPADSNVANRSTGVTGEAGERRKIEIGEPNG